MGQYPIPVVILTRLAVARRDQGRGIGLAMLRDAIRRTLAIAEQAGIRALLTHPLDDQAAGFYERFGFVRSLTGATTATLAQGCPAPDW